MQHLFDVWSHVTDYIRTSEHVLLLFDYDGTLTPIEERPELASLSSESRQLLKFLAGKRRFTAGIVSGRALSELRNKVGLNNIIYAGNHGLEIEGPRLNYVHPITDEVKSIVRLLGQVLTKSLNGIRGARVEDKGLTLSVHYRLVDDNEKAEEVKNTFERVVGVARVLGKVKTTSGKKVYEVRPAVAWDKGKATKLIMKKHARNGRRSGVLPIYLGDDLTDEDAFKVIEGYGGISVYVGDKNPQSMARYSLQSPAEVNEFMRRLLMIE